MKVEKEYRSEEEILFSGASDPMDREPDPMFEGTTFAGYGKVCSESLTPFPARARSLRTRNYW